MLSFLTIQDAKISELSSKIAEQIGFKKGLKYAALHGKWSFATFRTVCNCSLL